MTLTFVPGNAGSYQCMSTDLVNGKVPGASYIGADLFMIDTGLWYRIADDLTLQPIYTESTVQATSSPLITVDSSFTGQIYISSSSINVSGSNLSVTNRNGFIFKPHPSNPTGAVIWCVNHGGLTTGSLASGFPVSTGELYMYSGSGLSYLDYGTSIANACLCWSKI
jgi:hypothetical protein